MGDPLQQRWDRDGLRDLSFAWLDAVPDPVACLSGDLRLIYTNRACDSLLRTEPEAAADADVRDSHAFGRCTDDVLALISSVEECEASEEGGATEERELCFEGDDGVKRWFRVSVNVERSDVAGTRYLVIGREVTRSRADAETLRASEADFRALADNSPDNILRYDLDGRAIYCNRETLRATQLSASEVIGRTPHEMASQPMEGLEDYEAALFTTLRTGERTSCVLEIALDESRIATHSVVFHAERDAKGDISGAVAVGRDVSALVEAQQAAREREREFRTLAENAPDPIARWDLEGRYTYANPPMLSLLRQPASEVYGLSAGEIITGAEQEGENAVVRVLKTGESQSLETAVHDPRFGEDRIHQVQFVPERDELGRLVGVLGIGRDITDSVRDREALDRLAYTDPLTGLANSQMLHVRAPAMLAAAQRAGHHVAVLMLDLDGFKAINDSLGHAGGDRVLKALAERVGRKLRPYDLFARLGGDEFVIAADIEDPARDVEHLSARIQRALVESDDADGVQVHASIGVAVYPEDGDTVEGLLQHADIAMYEAKRSGRSRVEYFRPELASVLRRRAALEAALEDPGLYDQLEIHVQASRSLYGDHRSIGAEALLRWNHPELGFVPPAEFIAVAEDTGVIRDIGRWVIRQGAEIAARWNRDRSPDQIIAVAVNVSTRQFDLDDVQAVIDEALEATGCDPGWFALEITESLLLADSEHVHATLEHLRERGVRVAIDDFGTGYSALHYLARFPLDVMKIDRSFIQGLGSAGKYDEVVRSLFALAKVMGLRTIAEGVETREQLALIESLGCDHVQGFLLHRPVPVAQFEAEGLGQLPHPVFLDATRPAAP